MIFKAIEFSTKAHTGLYRKGTKIPYITHPLNVAQILIEYVITFQMGILNDYCNSSIANTKLQWPVSAQIIECGLKPTGELIGRNIHGH